MKRFKKIVSFLMILLIIFPSIQIPCIGNELPSGISGDESTQGSTPSAISTVGSTQGSTPSAVSAGGSTQVSTLSAVSAGESVQGSTPSAISTGGSTQISTSSALSVDAGAQAGTSSAVSTANGAAMKAVGLPTDAAINFKLSAELATGGAINTVTVFIYDSNANPVKDRIVYFGTNFGVISQNSAVTNESGKASVTVTSGVSGAAVVSMSFPDESGWKSDRIEIKFSPTEDPDLKADCEWLTADAVFGSSYITDISGTEINYIVSSNAKKLNMLGQGPKGSSISWNSSNPGLIAPDGTVIAPTDGQEMGALITAILSRGEAKTAKMFFVRVTHFNLSTEDEKAIYFDSCWLDEYIGNLGIVAGNISLPAVGANGSTISWTSDNPAVITPDGTVTRPGYAQYYADGQKYILTATLSKGTAEKVAKPCTIQVKPLDKTEEDTAVCSDYDWLDESVLTYGGDQFNLSCVTWNLYLPGTGSNGSTISWTSSDPAVVTTGGAITRPSLAEGNKIVTLTAVISKGNTAVQKKFQATVLPVVTSAERVALDKEWLTAAVILNGNSIDDVKTNIWLPESGQELANDHNSRSTISWESSDINTVSTKGKVTRPGITENDRTVTLTATITFGDATDKKSFDIVVTKKEKLPVALKFEDFTNSEEKLQFNGLSGMIDTTDDSGKNIKALQFTNGVSSSGGSVFTKNKIHLNNDMSFSTAFAFKSRHDNYILGESVFTFVLQAGDNKAYSQNEIKPSLSVSIDRSFKSYQGSGQATGYGYEDYAEVFYNGNNDASVENGRRIKAGVGNTNTLDNAGFIWIDYNGQAKTLEIRYSYTPARPDYTELKLDNIDLGQILMGVASTTAAGIDAVQDIYAGFIGSSGSAKDNIEIFEWTFKNGTVPIDPQIYSFVDASNLTLSAYPTEGASSSTITASVNGIDGPVMGLPIEFSSAFGSLDSSSQVTDASGKASAILSTSTSGNAIVKAIASGGAMSTVEVSLTITGADIIVFDKNWLTNERILNGNSDLNNVIKDLSLPVLGVNGSKISWISSKEGVVSADGKVTRPSYTQGDQTVTLTAAISKDSSEIEKSFDIIVKKLAPTDQEALSLDYEWLTNERVLNGNSALDNITKDLYLPALGANGSSISWTSSPTAIVATDGKVTRPSYTVGDRAVTLTATVSKGSAQVVKSFDIMVRKLAPTDQEALSLDYEWLTNERVLNGNSTLDNITGDLYLPVLGANGSTISWISSKADTVATDGKVTRPLYTQGDQAVTLTAALSRYAESLGKTVKTERIFYVTVKVLDSGIVIADRGWLTDERVLNGNSALDNITKDLYLPTLGVNGSNISWISSKEATIATDGKVTRPSYTQGDQEVVLTATITKYSENLGKVEKTQKIFNVTVKVPDSDIAAADRDWLTNTMVLNGNSDLNNIIKDLYLPALGVNGSSISWTSSKSAAVTTDGKVTRPLYAQGDQTVTLTAVIRKGSVQFEKSFDIMVRKLAPTDKEAVALDYEWLTNELILNGNNALDNIKKDLYLPVLGINGSNISWISSKAVTVAANGKVTRPTYAQGDQTIVLTATLSKCSENLGKTEKTEKIFDITVKALDSGIVAADREWLTDERILNGNSALDNITKDLYLPVLGINGSNISWTSSKEDAVSAGGKVTRPSYTQGDQKVTLTATLSKYSESLGKTEKTEKIFNVTVKVPDSDITAADREWLTDELVLNGNSDLDNIIKDLYLPVIGAGGSSISWVSSRTTIVATDGKVTRASYTDGDRQVTLTATIRKGSAQVEKSFAVTVKKLAPTDKEAVSLDDEWLTETIVLNGNNAWYNVMTNLKLPVIGPNGTSISWTSSNDAVVAPDGMVKQPSCAQGDQSVKLTAAISRGSEKTEKVFSIEVKSKATDKEAVSFDYKWLDIEMVLNGNSRWSDVIKDLKLPLLGPNGTEISWSSTREDVIAADGKVNRLSWSVGSVYVTLTAVISKGGESLQKEFLLEVTRLDQTDPEAVAEDTKSLDVSHTLGMNLSQYSISQNLSLPASAYCGSSITWTSNTPEVISDNGIVTRPEYGEMYRRVTLTAVLSKGAAKASKTFVYTVLPKPDTYAPRVTDTTPKDNSADIAWNTREITVTFDENIKRGTLTGTAGANSLGIQFQGFETQQISARIDNNKLIITSYSDLTSGENVLIVPQGAVTDMSGNPAEGFKLSFSVEQKQSNKIEVVASNPEDMAKQVAVNTKISFSYNYSSISKGSAFSGISIRTKAGGVIPAEPVLNGAEVTLNLHAALQSGTVYEITIPAGAVQDRFENFSSEKTILFRTALSAQESEIIGVYPLDSQRDVDIHERIEIRFSNTMKAKDCKLVLKDQKGNLIQTIARSLNTSQSAVILEPFAPLMPNTEYTVEGPYLSSANSSKLDFSMSFTTGANALEKVKLTPAATNDVPVNAPLAIEFGTAVNKGPEFSKIKIVDSKGSAVIFSADEKDQTAVLTPSSKLAEAETYIVSIPKGAYKDENSGVNDAFKFEFTTAKQLEPDSFTVNPSTTWLINKPLKFSTTGIENLFKQSGYQAASYEWGFGDGQNSEESNPVHTYSIPGNYQVRLKLKDDKGFSYEFNQTVTIESMDLSNLEMSVSSEGRDHIYIQSDDSSSLKKLYKIQLRYNGGFVTGETIRVKLYKNGTFQKDLGTVTAGIGDNEYLFPFYYGSQGYLGTYELVFACEGLLKGKVIRKPVIVDEGFCIGSVRVKLYDYNTGYLDEPTWFFNIDGVKREAVREWYNEEDGYCYIIRNVQLSTSHTIDPWLFTVDMRYYRDGPVFLPYTEEGLLIYTGTKIGPGVNKVTFDFTDKGEFSFIEGVDTGVVSFIVDGNWDATRAGYYEMKTDSGRLNIKSTKPQFKLNAGTELRAGEELYVRMVSYYGSASSWRHVNVQVLPRPSLDFGPKLSITFAKGEYHISMPMGISTIIGEGIPLLDKIPLLGNSKSFGLNDDNTILDGKLDDGWIYLDFGGGFGYKSITEKKEEQKKKVKITSVGYEIDADMRGELGLQYDYDAKVWKLCYGELELLGFVDKQWGRKYCLPKVNIGIGATLDIGTYIGGDLIIDKSGNSKADYSGIIKIEPIVKASVQAGPDWLNVTFTVDGSIPAEIHIPTGYIGVDVSASAHVGATCLLWSEDHLVDVELFHEHWDNGKAKVKAAAADSAVQAEAAQSPAEAAGTGNTGLKPMSRDYLDRASKASQSSKSLAASKQAAAGDSSSQTQTIKENVFPEAGVQLVRNGNELWTVWTDDNPERSSMNRTQMRTSILKDGKLSEPVWMGQDGTADFDPAAAAASGGVMMAWQNIKKPMEENVDIATFAKNAEISVTEGVYKAGGSEPKLVTLTDDDKYDHSPKLAADGNRALLVWTKSEGLGLNMGDDLKDLQSPANSDRLFFSSWNGSTWSTPVEIEGSLPTVLNSSLTMHGDTGLLLYTLDMDNNLATDEDREVFARTCVNNTWGGAVRITDNQVSDSDPKAVWCNGEWFITWYRDGGIMYQIGLNGKAETEEFLSKVEGNYKIAQEEGTEPLIAVVYESAGEDSVRNLSAAFYDAKCGVWSDQILLTKEKGCVKSFSPIFSEDQKLNIVYTQAEVITEVINGVGQKSISDKVDLNLLTYTPVHDLALAEEDGLQLSPDYPLPCTVETVTATIRNEGDFAEKAMLCLYDGNPKEGGTKIGEASTAQPIPARSSAEIQVEWLVDQAEKDAYNIYAVVQPEGDAAEKDTGNNAINRKITTADVAVTGLECDNTDSDQYLVKVTVANKGSKSLENVKIQLDQGGAAIETKELGGLWPGEEEEFSLIFSSVNLSKDASGKIKLTLRVLPPEGIVENTTDNNKAEFVLEPASIVVDGTDPIQGEKQAGVGKPFILRFSMPVEAGAGFDQIALTDEDLNIIAITAKLDGSILTVTPKSALAYGTQYILTIPVNALGDSYGHTMKSDYSLNFTTVESCPEVIFAYPGNGTEDIAPGEQIRMQYNQGILAGPAFKNITMVGPDSKKISAAASLQGKWLTIRPSGSLDKNTQYSLTIPKGAIVNSNGELQREDYKLEFTTASVDKPVPSDNPTPSDNPGGANSGTVGNSEKTDSSKGAAVKQPEYMLSRQTAKDGVSTVTVELDMLAVSRLKTERSIAVLDVSGEVKKDGIIRVSLSGSAIMQLVTQKLGFSVITGKGNVCIPADLIKSLAGAGDNPVTITVAEDKKKLKDNGRVSTGSFDFSMMAGGKPVTKFKPGVIVTIPLDMSKVGNAKRVIACVYSEGAHSWQPVGGTADAKGGTVTFGTGHFSTYAAFENVKTFKDVKVGWAKEKVEILASRHLIEGITDETYNPDGSITRAEFTVLIARSLYMDLSKSTGIFTDVAKDSWYADAVETAYALGLVSGTGADRYEPDAKISREQLAVIAYRLYQYKGGKRAGNSVANTFADRRNISSYAQDAVNFAAGAGIMKGNGDKFDPKRGATRQEAAVVLYRLLEYMGEL